MVVDRDEEGRYGGCSGDSRGSKSEGHSEFTALLTFQYLTWLIES